MQPDPAPVERRTPADYARALVEAGGNATEAARLLGVVPSAVTQAAKRHGLRVNPPGRPRRDVVCWVSDVVRINSREFVALHVDVGTARLAELLDVSLPVVSRRLRNLRKATEMSDRTPGRGKRSRDLEGRRFGRLVAKERAGWVTYGDQRLAAWLCECDCGGTKDAIAKSLLTGGTRSCGCLNGDVQRALAAARKAARAA